MRLHNTPHHLKWTSPRLVTWSGIASDQHAIWRWGSGMVARTGDWATGLPPGVYSGTTGDKGGTEAAWDPPSTPGTLGLTLARGATPTGQETLCDVSEMVGTLWWRIQYPHGKSPRSDRERTSGDEGMLRKAEWRVPRSTLGLLQTHSRQQRWVKAPYIMMIITVISEYSHPTLPWLPGYHWS